MLNSANYVLSDRDEKGVHLTLNSGESILPDADMKDPEVKVYYHQVPGAITHMSDGVQIQFLGGQFATKNADVKAYLDKIADKRGSMVFTKKTVGVTYETALAASDAARPAGDQKNEASTVDSTIEAAMNRKTSMTGVVEESIPNAEVRALLKPGIVPAVRT